MQVCCRVGALVPARACVRACVCVRSAITVNSNSTSESDTERIRLGGYESAVRIPACFDYHRDQYTCAEDH